MKIIVLSLVILAAVSVQSVEAYVGPGAGLSLVGALWGLLLAIGAALAFIIVWPLRRLRRRGREKREEAADQQGEPGP